MELGAIPESGVLLHIGVMKTGTTSLQKDLLSSLGQLQQSNILAKTPDTWYKNYSLMDGKPAREQAWLELEQELSGHTGRVVISNESICAATAEQADRLVRRLDRPVTVMVSMRSMADLLPSTWQQRIKMCRSLKLSYQDWLREIIADEQRSTAVFWEKQDLAKILRNWGAAVGEENLVFVMVDKRSPDILPRVTEQLLGLEDSTLGVDGKSRESNQSLSYDAAELLRQVVLESGLPTRNEQRKLSKLLRRRLARSEQIRESIPIPTWAADGIRPVAESFAADLRASAATLIGDVDQLAVPTRPTVDSLPEPSSVPFPYALIASKTALDFGRGNRSAKPAASATRSTERRYQRLLKSARSRSK